MKSLTNKDKSIIGMVHVHALPGTPKNKLSIKEICLLAVGEAQTLRDAGFDAIIIENMHDVPYLKIKVGPEIVAAMTYIAAEIKQKIDIPVGIQILAGANKEAVAAAYASGCQFVRVEGFVFAHVADEGIIESCAGELLRYRKMIGAENIKIFADIKKKHSSHSITADVNITETAHAAHFFGADALIITGSRTGKNPDRNELREAGAETKIPILVGSGTTPEVMTDLWKYADGFIIGSYIKEHGCWKNSIDLLRTKQIIQTTEKLRHQS